MRRPTAAWSKDQALGVARGQERELYGASAVPCHPDSRLIRAADGDHAQKCARVVQGGRNPDWRRAQPGCVEPRLLLPDRLILTSGPGWIGHIACQPVATPGLRNNGT